jgi:hypothetical protein
MPNEIKGFWVRALALPDNELLIIKYQITESNIGKMQLSNAVAMFPEKLQHEMKLILSIIEKYNCEFYTIPKQNTKPHE